jgi:Tol biopolymer transport system component
MKRCPECRKDYFDDSLLYCLDDGTLLVQGTVSDEPQTAILSGKAVSGDEPTRTFKSGETAVRKAAEGSRLVAIFSPARLPWVVALALLVIAAAFASAYFSGRSGGGLHAIRLAFEPPRDLGFNDTESDWATISPDGRKVVFSAAGADAKRRLYIRDLDSDEARPLAGSDEPVEPFWSPDSRSVAYGSQGKLKRSEITGGGNAKVLCDAARMVGGAWSKDGVIIFVPDYRTAAMQVSAQGGEPRAIPMNDDRGESERHRYPYFLPGGRRFLIYREQKGIWAGSLDSPESKEIVANESVSDHMPFVYAPQGYLLALRNDTIVAQAFDASKLAVTAEPITIIAGSRNDTGGRRFSVSDSGTLLWQGMWQRDYQLTWFDRAGKQIGTVDAPTKISVGQDPHISPDGKRVVIKKDFNLWIIDLETNTPQRFTTTFAQNPIWSPDGTKIVYSGPSGSVGGLSIKNSNGSGESESLLPGANFPRSFTPDGRFLLFLRRGVKTRLDIYVLPMFGERKEYVLLESAFNELQAQISPDGKWLAYQTDETGDNEVYVQSFTSDGKLGGDKKRVSTSGGRIPLWRHDGSELFFSTSDGTLMAAAVKTGGAEFQFDTPKPLFKTRMLMWIGNVHEYDVSPDGQRFLIGTLQGDAKAPPPTVILNWLELLKK